MAQNLQLPDQVFKDLQALAEAGNVTPEEWIAAKVSEERPKEINVLSPQPLPELLDGLIGMIDSGEAPHTGHPDMLFTKGLVEKYEKQGLKFTEK